ncbi:MAG TPA: carbohydrate kinase family protein [Candidatus Methanomethylia archaeon]|nr:carbohydrate kinase family protein [Candidatus Methanomethylicia archaeon]
MTLGSSLKNAARVFDTLAVGNLNVDITAFVESTPPPDGEVEARVFHISFGGSAANFAVALSRLSSRVGLIAHIGSDEMGKSALAELEREKVYTRLIRVEKGRTTGYVLVLVERSGVKRMVAFRGANQLLSSRSLPLKAARRAKIVHASSVKPSTAEGIAAKAVRGGAVFTYDPGGSALKYPLKEFAPVLEKTHILFVNSTEVKAITGISDPKKAADVLSEYAPTVVVKMGAKGVYAVGEEEREFIPAFEVEEVVDTTGAGDAFNAGFIKGLLLGLSFRECCIMGNAVAALKIAHPGARGGLPTLQQVSEFLRARGVFIRGL